MHEIMRQFYGGNTYEWALTPTYQGIARQADFRYYLFTNINTEQERREDPMVYQVAVEVVTPATSGVAETSKLAVEPTSVSARDTSEAILKIALLRAKELSELGDVSFRVKAKEF